MRFFFVVCQYETMQGLLFNDLAMQIMTCMVKVRGMKAELRPIEWRTVKTIDLETGAEQAYMIPSK